MVDEDGKFTESAGPELQSLSVMTEGTNKGTVCSFCLFPPSVVINFFPCLCQWSQCWRSVVLWSKRSSVSTVTRTTGEPSSLWSSDPANSGLLTQHRSKTKPRLDFLYLDQINILLIHDTNELMWWKGCTSEGALHPRVGPQQHVGHVGQTDILVYFPSEELGCSYPCLLPQRHRGTSN